MVTVFDMSTGEALSTAAAADQENLRAQRAQWPVPGLQLQPVTAEPQATPQRALPPDLAMEPVAAFLRRHGD
jgi:hypothetical protein